MRKIILSILVSMLAIPCMAFVIAIVSGNEVLELRQSDTPFPTNSVYPVPDFVLTTRLAYLTYTNGVIVMKSQEEIDALLAAEELAWQNNKLLQLKQLENMYVDFLTNDWTMCLRGYSIITNTATITVTNTDSTANVTYLMQVRSVDTNQYKALYGFYAGEFDRFSKTIEKLGGVMNKVIVHTLP